MWSWTIFPFLLQRFGFIFPSIWLTYRFALRPVCLLLWAGLLLEVLRQWPSNTWLYLSLLESYIYFSDLPVLFLKYHVIFFRISRLQSFLQRLFYVLFHIIAKIIQGSRLSCPGCCWWHMAPLLGGGLSSCGNPIEVAFHFYITSAKRCQSIIRDPFFNYFSPRGFLGHWVSIRPAHRCQGQGSCSFSGDTSKLPLYFL